MQNNISKHNKKKKIKLKLPIKNNHVKLNRKYEILTFK